MRCFDCFHSVTCGGPCQMELEQRIYTDSTCECFLDKDLVVKLPVELGSIAYCDAFLNGFVQECRIIAVHVHDEPSRYRKSYILVRLPSGGSAKILVKDIPERLFSTKEAAKAAVAERTKVKKD